MRRPAAAPRAKADPHKAQTCAPTLAPVPACRGYFRLIAASEADLLSMDPHPTPDADFRSSQVFDAVAAALHRVTARLDDACPKQTEAARLIRIGQLQEALPLISECVSHWQDVQASLVSASAAIGQRVEDLAGLLLPGAGEGGQGAPGGAIAELAALLEGLKRFVQARDWVGLADAMEYDLTDLAQRWRAALLQPDEVGESGQSGSSGQHRMAPAA